MCVDWSRLDILHAAADALPQSRLKLLMPYHVVPLVIERPDNNATGMADADTGVPGSGDESVYGMKT